MVERINVFKIVFSENEDDESWLVVVLIWKLIVVLEFIECLFFYLYDILGFIYNF